MRLIESSDDDELPPDTTSSPTSTGVKKTPISVDADALQMAAGTLPRAIDTSAIADCTVAGNMHRNSTPE